MTGGAEAARRGESAGIAWAMALLVGGLLASGTAQSRDEMSLEGPQLGLELLNPWPDSMCEGYWPLQLELRNDSPKERELRLEATLNYDRRNLVQRRITLEGGETLRTELLLPTFTDGSGMADLTLYEKGRAVIDSGPIGPRCYDRTAPMLVAHDVQQEWAVDELWGQSLRDGLRHSVHEDADAESVARLGFDALSADYGAYAGLGAVILAAENGLPEDEAMAALLAWARLGGLVVILGPEAEALARAEPRTARWMEERFAVPVLPPGERAPEQGHLPMQPPEGTSAWQVGRGHLVVIDAPVGHSELAALGFFDTFAQDEPLAHRARHWEYEEALGWVRPVIPGIDEVPVGQFSLILLLTAILLVPVNYVAVRLLKRPTAILITTPILSIGAVALIVGAGLARFGLDTRTADFSYHILDQRSGRVSGETVQSRFAGTSPGRGLRPEAGTRLMPLDKLWNFRYSADLNDGLSVSGSFLQVRSVTRTLLLTDRASRLRLEVGGAPEAPVVRNGLDAEVRKLWLKDSEGRVFVLPAGEALGPGRESTLTAADEDHWWWAGSEMIMQVAWDQELRQRMPGPIAPGGSAHMPRGSWFAVLEESPFIDDLGIRSRQVAGEHYLFGLLELSNEGAE